MREIVITSMQGVNLEALDASLRALPDAAVKGVSLRRGNVIVHLAADADEKQANAIRGHVSGHDPRKLSAAQQAQKTRDEQLRAAHDDAKLARQANTGSATLGEQVALLTRRIAWLEKTLEALVAAD